MSESQVAVTRRPRRQARGAARHDAIVQAAVDLILTEGPATLSHRAVAAKAGVPLAATTYYFEGLDELMRTAGEFIAEAWCAHARLIADIIARPTAAPVAAATTPLTPTHPGLAAPTPTPATPGLTVPGQSAPTPAAPPAAPPQRRVAHIIATAVLPVAAPADLRGWYEHLVTAGRTPATLSVYRSRAPRLQAAIADILQAVNMAADPALTLAAVDGAAITAIATGADPHQAATVMVETLIRPRLSTPGSPFVSPAGGPGALP